MSGPLPFPLLPSWKESLAKPQTTLKAEAKGASQFVELTVALGKPQANSCDFSPQSAPLHSVPVSTFLFF